MVQLPIFTWLQPHIKTSGRQWYYEHLGEVRRKNLTDDDLLTTLGKGVGGGGGGIESNLSNFCIPVFIQTNFASSGTSRCWFKASCINIVNEKKIVAVKEATHAVEKNSTCRDPNPDCWLLQRSTGNWASSIPAIELASSIPYIIVHTEIVGFAM